MSESSTQRVLVVYQSLPHYRLDVFRELEALDGLSVEYAAGDTNVDGTIKSIDPADLGVVHPLKNVWRGKFLWQRGLLKLLWSKPWDAVIFLGDFAYLSTWVGAAMMRVRPSTRVLFWTIGWHRPETGLRKFARMGFYRIADDLLLYGDVARGWGEQMGYPAKRMHTIYNSSSRPSSREVASPERLAELEQELPAAGTPCVGTVIRINANKRLDLLIDAVARARKLSGLDIHVALAGRGTEEQALAEQAARLDVPLHLVGAIYADEELELFYSRSLVTVIPTLAGLSVLQSFRYGRPVLTHDDPTEQVPESEAIVPGSTGAIYAKGNVDALAHVIVEWIARVQDDPEGTAQACRDALTNRWSPKPQAEAIGRVLRQQR